MTHKLINKIKKEIADSKLPGQDAQLKMISYKKKLKPPAKDAKKAGILILLYLKKKDLFTVLIQRNKYPGVHSGQISFPGGQKEKNDKDLIHTAIREAEEELGADLTNINIIGTLTPLYIEVSNFDVLPVIGWLKGTPTFKPDIKEVENIIEIKLKDLLDDKNIDFLNFTKFGKKIKAPCYSIKKFQIWGATAMIISELVEIIKIIEKK